MLKYGIGGINAVIIFPADQNIVSLALSIQQTSHQDLNWTELHYVEQLC